MLISKFDILENYLKNLTTTSCTLEKKIKTLNLLLNHGTNVKEKINKKIRKRTLECNIFSSASASFSLNFLPLEDLEKPQEKQNICEDQSPTSIKAKGKQQTIPTAETALNW